MTAEAPGDGKFQVVYSTEDPITGKVIEFARVGPERFANENEASQYALEEAIGLALAKPAKPTIHVRVQPYKEG